MKSAELEVYMQYPRHPGSNPATPSLLGVPSHKDSS
uniref:Uncharacterized protein n=1 Tax=Arundo donax TaxID=35708 RepID=A0A0A9CCU3_ARUDO